MLLFSLGLALLALELREPVSALGRWGYLGVFVVMIINSATIILPSVGYAVLAASTQALNPVLVGIVGGLGATIGETTSYFLGRTGRSAMAGTGLLQRLLLRSEGRWVGPVLFVFAALPLPFDIASIYAGTIHYPLHRYLLWVCPGKVIKTIMLAVGSYYAIGWLERIMG